MARRNDARLGRNSTQAPTFAIVFTDFIIIMTYVTLMVACFGFTAWSWIYGPPAQAADPAGVIPYEQTEKGFVVTGGGIMTYPAPEEKAPHQQMLPTAGLHNSQGDRVREISESRPAYEHRYLCLLVTRPRDQDEFPTSCACSRSQRPPSPSMALAMLAAVTSHRRATLPVLWSMAPTVLHTQSWAPNSHRAHQPKSTS